MNAVDALKAAQAAGIQVSIDDDDLILEAPAPPPQNVLTLLAHHKAGILTLLYSAEDWSLSNWRTLFGERAGHFEFDCGMSRTAAEARAFDCCVVEWLNRNPAPSPAGRCSWCKQVESHDAVVLPYGAESGNHAWLHPKCWPMWHRKRRADATVALREIGLPTDKNKDKCNAR